MLMNDEKSPPPHIERLHKQKKRIKKAKADFDYADKAFELMMKIRDKLESSYKEIISKEP